MPDTYERPMPNASLRATIYADARRLFMSDEIPTSHAAITEEE